MSLTPRICGKSPGVTARFSTPPARKAKEKLSARLSDLARLNAKGFRPAGLRAQRGGTTKMKFYD